MVFLNQLNVDSWSFRLTDLHNINFNGILFPKKKRRRVSLFPKKFPKNESSCKKITPKSHFSKSLISMHWEYARNDEH